MAREKSFAVIGLGQYGLSIANALIENNQQVIGIDRDEARVKMLEKRPHRYLKRIAPILKI